MTHPADDIEDRLTTALHAEADGVRPEPGSLEAIRTRGRAARRRRRAVLTGAGVAALVAVAVAVPAIDRANQQVTTGSDRASTTTTEAPAA